jgi:hypothetical protein
MENGNFDTIEIVYTTKDYSIFNHIEGNREVNKIHVERLKKSFNESYLLNPIIVNGDMQIIDGQHRFLAASQLNLPINYIVCKKYGLKEIQVLNSNMKNWSKLDYLDGFCDLGKEEYIKFRDFKEKFPEFTFSGIEHLLNGSDNRKEKDFQNGNLKLNNYSLSILHARSILRVKPFYDGFSRRCFVAAMTSVLKKSDFDIERFINKLNVCPRKMEHCANVKSYKAAIESIYNWKSSKKINLRF